ncbi:hypothetical protein CR513_22096, partial [Mucuna pruriens]
MDRSMIDAASGGALMDKTPTTTRLLISNMASNTQQFKVRGGTSTSRNVSEVNTFDSQRLENQLTELTSLVRQLAVSQHQQVVQGICASVEHPTDMCPTLEESETEKAIVPAESKSSIAYNTKVWTRWDHVGFESSQLSTVGTKTPGTTIPPTTASANTTIEE